MKKFIFAVFAFLTIPTAFAFRDVAPNSPIHDAVQNLLDRKLMDDGGFFRANDPVPAELFWKIVLRDSGFDPKSATFDTPLPSNIDPDDPLAPFLREAIRRGFIDHRQKFNPKRPITRIQAIKTLVKIKAIPLPRRNSTKFRKKVSGISKTSKHLPALEAAFASGILELSDISPVRPYAFLTRRNLAIWIWRFDDHGVKKSKLDSSFDPEKYRRGKKSEKKSGNRRATRNIRVLQIQKPRNLKIPNGKILESVFSAIESRYKFIDELTPEKKREMIDAGIAAMVKKMGDKYSSYIEPEKAEEFQDDLDGKFEGIGAFVEMIDDKFTITAPIKGSPAEKAGLLPDDVVIEVDGESIAENTIQQSIKLIKGPAGSEVELTILRDLQKKKIRITRGKITIPPITLKWKKSIPIIGIHQFNRNTRAKFLEIWEKEVLPKNPRGLVLDLRNNPGGFLSSAVELGEIFLEKNKKIFDVEYLDGKQQYKSSHDGRLLDFWKNKKYPIAVLQNKGSASASEIFTSMIQDYKIGKIVGSTSRGKGTVQEILNYSNGGILKLTIAKWLSPDGRWIHETGVKPDIEVPDPTHEQRKQKIDPQLDRAIAEVLGY